MDGTASIGLLTAMLKSPSRISSLLELILDSSKLASSLQNSNALESGGLYIAMRLTALKPVLILKQVDSIVSSGWPLCDVDVKVILIDNGNTTTSSAMSRDRQCLVAIGTKSSWSSGVIFPNPGLCEDAQIQVVCLVSY